MIVPERSDLISSPEEARAYYSTKLVGEHKIDCYGRGVTIAFEAHATHVFSEEFEGTIPGAEQVRTRVPGGRVEVRRFSLDRARLMDEILPGITQYTVSTPGTAAIRGAEKRLLHGPRLPDGRYLRIVLRPGYRTGLFICVSAYPVEQRVWSDACRSRRAKFPP